MCLIKQLGCQEFGEENGMYDEDSHFWLDSLQETAYVTIDLRTLGKKGGRRGGMKEGMVGRDGRKEGIQGKKVMNTIMNIIAT